MQETRRGSVTLVLGGARSGKSRYAQQLAERCERVVFIATAKPSDEEMQLKIDRHRADRPQSWLTIEEPTELPQVLTQHAAECDLIVVDCLTLFAANVLEAEGENREATEHKVSVLCDTLKTIECPVVLVSNEVGSGVVPAYESGIRYRDLLGEINQCVARVADDVVLMVAGIPLALKGYVEVTA